MILNPVPVTKTSSGYATFAHEKCNPNPDFSAETCISAKSGLKVLSCPRDVRCLRFFISQCITGAKISSGLGLRCPLKSTLQQAAAVQGAEIR
ncbi:hypothetical protein BDZ97DRAFT_356618 [Flammula alnicola]|nr:hypothetical protein BDZ97DRAFT_356618 [Flammula alnicola]